MLKHQNNSHNGQEANFKVEVLNMKTEWHQLPLWCVQSEIYKGQPILAQLSDVWT